MITELDQTQTNIQNLKEGISLCEDCLSKAEKYERLQSNPDWLGVIEDIKVLIGIHEKEIQHALTSFEDKTVIDELKILNFIKEHKTRKNQLEEGLLEPSRILRMAVLAREKLPEMKAELEKQEQILGGNNAA